MEDPISIIENCFPIDVYNNTPLYVPEGTIEKYKSTDYWSKFKFILEGSPFEHTLTYLVDGILYTSYKLEEGDEITLEESPTKEGYTFSGWSEIPTTMPDHDLTIIGSFTINHYKLTYQVENETYKTYDMEYGATISPENSPVKEGYTFSGWTEIPETMPANDVIVTGTFTINKYKVTYMVDGIEYKTTEIEFGSSLTAETEPTKEGYTFSGWSGLPETMPANDVTITGSFTVNKYKLTYTLDDKEFKTIEVDYGTALIPEESPTKEGYTFSGWSGLPATMPANDVIVTGSFSVNKYKLIYTIDGKEYKTVEVEYGSTITPEQTPEGDYASFEWVGVPEIMPAHDVTVTATYTTGINGNIANRTEVNKGIFFNLNGQRIEGQPTKKGVYIKNGKKVLMK